MNKTWRKVVEYLWINLSEVYIDFSPPQYRSSLEIVNDRMRDSSAYQGPIHNHRAIIILLPQSPGFLLFQLDFCKSKVYLPIFRTVFEDNNQSSLFAIYRPRYMAGNFSRQNFMHSQFELCLRAYKSLGSKNKKKHLHSNTQRV